MTRSYKLTLAGGANNKDDPWVYRPGVFVKNMQRDGMFVPVFTMIGMVLLISRKQRKGNILHRHGSLFSFTRQTVYCSVRCIHSVDFTR